MEIQYDLAIEATAIRRTVALADSYILHERLPQKAIKLLRSLCEDLQFDRSQGQELSRFITERRVTEKVAEMTGIPFDTLAGEGDQIDYVASLSEFVVGQDYAVREVANELALIRAGMVEANKPASVMLFVGQTGTGKTELAKALATIYASSRRLRTFTLGNFSEAHSISGLIGVPAGYVGHEQGGRLVNELNSDPYGVFLLDEADKAHPDVMQPFLNLFDEGWLYDQRGVKASANHAVFILTTNVAQRQTAEMFRQGKSRDDILLTVRELLSRTKHSKSNRPVFSPEFLARIKRVVLFNPLDLAAMKSISKLLTLRICRDWEINRQKRLVVPEFVVEEVAREAYLANEKSEGKEGGRIVRKLLAQYLETPIQKAISTHMGVYRACDQVIITADGASIGGHNGSPSLNSVAVHFSNAEGVHPVVV